MRFVFRVDRMGGKVEIRGLAVGAETIHRFERTVRDVVQSNHLPIRITITDNQEDRSDLVEKLHRVFTSEQAIAGKCCNSVLLSFLRTAYCAVSV